MPLRSAALTFPQEAPRGGRAGLTFFVLDSAALLLRDVCLPKTTMNCRRAEIWHGVNLAFIQLMVTKCLEVARIVFDLTVDNDETVINRWADDL